MKLYKNLRTFVYPSLVLLLALLPRKGESQETAPDRRLRFNISFSTEQSAEPLDGRVLLMISTDDSKEPRQQISDDPNTAQIFGIDVEGLKPGEQATIDQGVLGYPRKDLSEVPP